MYEYLLPIGSVVKLKGGERALMIFGILQRSPLKSNKIFDYIGVPYPEGHLDVRLHIGFDHDAVEQVLFRGYDGEDMDWEAYTKVLEIAASVEKENMSKAGKE